MNLTVQKSSFNLADLPVRDLDRQLVRQGKALLVG